MAKVNQGWQHVFNITVNPPGLFSRKWKAYAERRRVTSGAVEISYPGVVRFSAKGDTHDEAYVAVRGKIDQYAESLKQKDREIRKKEKYSYTVTTPRL